MVMRESEVDCFRGALDTARLSFTAELKKAGKVSADLDHQLQSHLVTVHVTMKRPAIPPSPSDSEHTQFKALPWRVISPVSNTPAANRKFKAANIACYEFTLTKLLAVAKRVKNTHSQTPMIFISKSNAIIPLF